MLRNYLLTEKDSSNVFAVIQGIDDTNISVSNNDLINKVGQAVEDEFGYEERVKVIHDSIVKTDKAGLPVIYISFRGLDEIEEEEIRDFVLSQVCIY